MAKEDESEQDMLVKMSIFSETQNTWLVYNMNNTIDRKSIF